MHLSFTQTARANSDISAILPRSDQRHLSLPPVVNVASEAASLMLGASMPPGCSAGTTLYASTTTNSHIELRWEACTNAAYQLETSSNMSHWRVAGSPLAAPAAGGWLTNLVSPLVNPQFFRLRVFSLTNSPVPTVPGVYSLYMTHQGIPRHYRLNIPSSYNPSAAAPLALILHGHNQTANEFAGQHPDLAALANARGMLLVFPDSTENGRGTGWNNNEPTPEFPVDDVDFLLQLIDRIDETLNIDRKRLYAGGFSNGGQMAHFLTARTTNVFAAIAAVGSAIGGDRGTGSIMTNPPPAGPISVLIVNATNDCKRPFYGGINDDGALQPAVRDAVSHYTNANSCTAVSAISTNYFVTNHGAIHRFEACGGNTLPPGALKTNLVIREHYQTFCTIGTEVFFVTLTDGGHIWPDANDNVGFDANREVLEFFLRHCQCDAQGVTNNLVVPSLPGIHDLFMCDQDYWRYFRLQIPTNYNASTPAPVVFVMHGGEQTVSSFSFEHPALFSKCQLEGAILVLPQALNHPVTGETLWSNKPFDYAADDRHFFTNMLEHLAASLTIDRKRVYAAGFSGGGSFSHYLAATTTNLLAAIAPVCTQTGWNDPLTGAIPAPPLPLEPIPVLMIRGTADNKRPYNGGPNVDGVLCRSAADDVAYWTSGNSCTPVFSTATVLNVTTHLYQNCAGTSEVGLVRIGGMPHIWPDASDGFNYDANVSVVDFLLLHSRP